MPYFLASPSASFVKPLLETMTPPFTKPEAHVKYMLSSYTDYLSLIREPLVESFVGWILLVFVSFPDFPLFFLIALLIILAIIVITLGNMMKILGEVDILKLKQQNEISKSTQDI